MKKRQMRNGEITHLPFLCCGNKNQSFLSTPSVILNVDILKKKSYNSIKIDIILEKS